MNCYIYVAMHKITEYLYIGSLNDVLKLPLGSKKFSLIISLCNSSKYPEFKHIPVIHIDIEDSEDVNIYKYFSYTNSLIERAKEDGNVLVHCRAGISRSVSIVLAYMMKTYRMSLDEAIHHVKNIRRIANPNIGFLKQLSEYEEKLK
jgi:protein-tyrosine phosphatase